MRAVLDVTHCVDDKPVELWGMKRPGREMKNMGLKRFLCLKVNIRALVVIFRVTIYLE